MPKSGGGNCPFDQCWLQPWVLKLLFVSRVFMSSIQFIIAIVDRTATTTYSYYMSTFAGATAPTSSCSATTRLQASDNPTIRTPSCTTHVYAYSIIQNILVQWRNEVTQSNFRKQTFEFKLLE